MHKILIPLILCIIPILGMCSLNNLEEKTPIAISHQDELENARMSVVDLSFDLQAGSAVLVGRRLLEGHQYLYRAVTAAHVTNHITNGSDDCSPTITFQLGFHDKPIQIKVDINVDYVLAIYDFSSFTFVSDRKFPCAHVATLEEFETLQAFETIYMVGCFGAYGQQCRTGVITTPNNFSASPDFWIDLNNPWSKYPEKFLRISCPLLPGDSGGGIFNSRGSLLSILNARTCNEISMHGDYMWEPTSGVGFKTSILYTIVNEDFFLIED